MANDSQPEIVSPSWHHLPSVATWNLAHPRKLHTNHLQSENCFTACITSDLIEPLNLTCRRKEESKELFNANRCPGMQELAWCAMVPPAFRSRAMAPVVVKTKQALRKAMERSKVYRKQVSQKWWTPSLASVYEGGCHVETTDTGDCSASVDELRQVARPLVSAGTSPPRRLRPAPPLKQPPSIAPPIPPPPKPHGYIPAPPPLKPSQRQSTRRQKVVPVDTDPSASVEHKNSREDATLEVHKRPANAMVDNLFSNDVGTEFFIPTLGDEAFLNVLTSWLSEFGFGCLKDK
jgi:hypothetical protein